MPNTTINLDEHYTYNDYRNWPQGEQWELINGIPHAMIAPLRIHQQLVGESFYQISGSLHENKARYDVYVAPFDVRLPHVDQADDEVGTTVEPDVSVICDQNKLDKYGCRGAPVPCALFPALTIDLSAIN